MSNKAANFVLSLRTDAPKARSVFCDGTCSNQVTPPTTCPPSSPGDCTCFGNFSIGQTCPGVQCTTGCSACRVTNTCFPQEVGPPACNGVCQQ